MPDDLPSELLDAAFRELAGTPGPTPTRQLDPLRSRFPHEARRCEAALERADELKWTACDIADRLERGRCPSQVIALRELAARCPGFGSATYEWALRDGWLINRW